MPKESYLTIAALSIVFAMTIVCVFRLFGIVHGYGLALFLFLMTAWMSALVFSLIGWAIQP